MLAQAGRGQDLGALQPPHRLARLALCHCNGCVLLIIVQLDQHRLQVKVQLLERPLVLGMAHCWPLDHGAHQHQHSTHKLPGMVANIVRQGRLLPPALHPAGVLCGAVRGCQWADDWDAAAVWEQAAWLADVQQVVDQPRL